MAFLAVLFLQCVSAFDLHLGSIEWINQDQYLDNRTTSLAGSAANYYYSAYHTSRNLSGNDGIYGAVYAGGQAYQGAYQYPTSQLGFFSSYLNWNANNPVNGDYTKSAGFIATSFLQLSEIDSVTGQTVQSIQLNTLPWAVAATYQQNTTATSVRLTGGVATTISGYGGGNNNNNQNQNNQNQNQQQQQQQVQTVLYGNLSVNIIIAITNHSGTMVSGSFITTKSVGLTIEILNFPYVNTSNQLRFTEVYVTATVDQVVSTTDLWNGFARTSVGTTDYSAGVSGVYFDLAHKAYINGVSRDATITSWAATYADLKNYRLYAMQLTQMLKMARNLNYFGFNITFAAGGQNVSWSQVYGAGSGPVAAYIPPEEAAVSTSSALILGLSKEAFGGVLAGVVIGVLLLILAVVFVYRIRQKRQDYPAAINDTSSSPLKSETTDQTENTGLIASEGQQNKYQALA